MGLSNSSAVFLVLWCSGWCALLGLSVRTALGLVASGLAGMILVVNFFMADSPQKTTWQEAAVGLSVFGLVLASPFIAWGIS